MERIEMTFCWYYKGENAENRNTQRLLKNDKWSEFEIDGDMVSHYEEHDLAFN